MLMKFGCLYLYYTFSCLSCCYLCFLGVFWVAFCIAGIDMAGIQWTVERMVHSIRIGRVGGCIVIGWEKEIE